VPSEKKKAVQDVRKRCLVKQNKQAGNIQKGEARGLERRKIMRPLRNGNKLEQNADGEPENDGSKPSNPVGKQRSPWGVGQKGL